MIARRIYTRGKVTLCVAAAGCFILWLALTAEGLKGGFTGDDLMNLYGAVHAPPSEIAGDLLLFFRPSRTFRPAGTAFYRLLFEGFALNPLPLRIFCHGLILVNSILACFLLKRLAGSWEAGLMGAALHLCHREFGWFYVNGGLCYDLLCLFFYSLAFLYYLRARESGRPIGPLQLAIWSCLYVLCLGSKEMAVSLPLMIGVHELLHNPPTDWSGRALGRWLLNEGRVPMWGALMTLAFIVGRVYGPGALTSMEAYRPVVSLDAYLDHARHFLWCASGRPGWMKPGVAAVIAVLFVAVAIRSRLPALRFGLAWMLIGILPVAFIQQRGLDAVCIPSLGLALFVAAGLDSLAKRGGRIAALAIFLAILGRIPYEDMTVEVRRIRAVDAELRERLPEISGRARVLLLENPLPPHGWTMVQLIALRYRDRHPTTFRLDLVMKHWKPAEVADFEVVLSVVNGRLVLCDAAPFQRVAVSDLPHRACRQLENPGQYTQSPIPEPGKSQAGSPPEGE